MRTVVFALGVVGVLSGISAYADGITVSAAPVTVVSAAPAVSVEEAQGADAPQVSAMGLRLRPDSTGLATATPSAVTDEPSGIMFMATGLAGVGGLMWRRRSLVG